MKILVETKPFRDAFARARGVVPSRTPKPSLLSVRLDATDSGTTLTATDLEQALTIRALGVSIDVPGSVLLPAADVAAILASSSDSELSLDHDPDSGTLTIRGARSEWRMQAEDVDLFPVVPEFPADAPAIRVAAPDLRTLIRRTLPAAEKAESTRFALTGTCFEPDPARGVLRGVATDGRKLAVQEAAAAFPDGYEPPDRAPGCVLPERALKALAGLLGDEGDADVVLAPPNAAHARGDGWTSWTRLVQGRFPDYRMVIPDRRSALVVPVGVGVLAQAMAQVAVMTDAQTRAVDWDLRDGRLRLEVRRQAVGGAHAEVPVACDGRACAVRIDATFLSPVLGTLDDDATIDLEVIDARNPVAFRMEGAGFFYVVMPMSRD